MGLYKRIIPCLDIDKGRVVKGVNFVGLKDAGDPLEVAKSYDAAGADEITILDISATHENRKSIIDLVEKIAAEVFIPLTFGGGIRELADIKNMLRAGADKVSINSAAVTNPDFVRQAAEEFGSQCIVVAIDAKQTGASKWEIFTHGGRKATGIDAVEWAKKMQDLGAGELLLTSMDRDGVQTGFDIPLTRTVADQVQIPVIASGGVGTLRHLVDGFTKGGADGVLAASIFHYATHSIEEAKNFIADYGIKVRR